jgi:hypothetical protein
MAMSRKHMLNFSKCVLYMHQVILVRQHSFVFIGQPQDCDHDIKVSF